MALRMGVPCTVPWLTSGYCVEEWLPQMMTFFTSDTGTFNRSETCQQLLGSRMSRPLDKPWASVTFFATQVACLSQQVRTQYAYVAGAHVLVGAALPPHSVHRVQDHVWHELIHHVLPSCLRYSFSMQA